MRLWPLPIDEAALNEAGPLWVPFLPDIAKRTKEPLLALINQVMCYETRVTLIWNDDTQTPDGLIGVRLHMRGNDLIAEIVWATGRDHKAWVHLLPELENLLRLAGVVEVRPICRPGWRKILEANGYKVTHLQMEKIITE